MCFCVSLNHLIPVLLGFVVLGLVSSVPSQEFGWKERLQNELSVSICNLSKSSTNSGQLYMVPATTSN